MRLNFYGSQPIRQLLSLLLVSDFEARCQAVSLSPDLGYRYVLQSIIQSFSFRGDCSAAADRLNADSSKRMARVAMMTHRFHPDYVMN